MMSSTRILHRRRAEGQQRRLFPRVPIRQTKVKTVVGSYATRNRECAAIILGNSSQFGGAESLAVRWAVAVLGANAAPQRVTR